MPRALTRPQFDRSSQHRRAMIAKVHVAKKEMGLVDDDYRQMLLDVTGRASSAHCTDAELAKLIDHLKSKGFQPKPAAPRRKAAPAPADHPSARKARALWISLHQLGAIANPSEKALEAFAKRQLGVQRLQWGDQGQSYKLIEALKAIGTRNGWDQDIGSARADTAVKMLKLRLCEAILAKLKAAGKAGAEWTLEEAAVRLLGEDREGEAIGSPAFWGVERIERLAQGLSSVLKGARR